MKREIALAVHGDTGRRCRRVRNRTGIGANLPAAFTVARTFRVA
jgi:hypothetical protein